MVGRVNPLSFSVEQFITKFFLPRIKLHLLPLLILAFIVLPVLTISGQEAPPPGRSLFLSDTAPTLDDMKLEVPPGLPVEAKNNPVPEDFRGLYQWPRKDGTKTSFQYQGFR